MATRRQVTAMLVALAVSGGLSGCVNIPSTGTPHAVDPSARPSAPPLNREVQPPPDDASIREILDGFMAAMANYQPNYEVARKYLAPDVGDNWRPETGVRIIANNVFPTASDDSASLSAPLVGRVDAQNAYEGAGGTIRHDFKMVRDANGQWRIGAPPEGLVMTEYDFDRTYRPINLYYLEPELGFLVPDPIYLPGDGLTPSALARRLAIGPTEWLRPGVVSMFNDKVTIVSVTIGQDGVTQVALGDQALALSEQQRPLMAAQVAWTLAQLGRVNAIRFTVNDTPFVVAPGQNDQTVRVDAMGGFSPVADKISLQLFGARPDGLVRLDDTQDQPPVPVDGPLGQMQWIEDLAISPDGNRAAVITGTGTQLFVGPIGDQPPVQVQAGASQLSRPQFTRFGDLVVQGRQEGGTQLWAIREDAAEVVPIELPKSRSLVAARISPDGMRAAVIITDDNGVDHLGLMVVSRSGSPRLIGFREIVLKPSRTVTLQSFADVVWTSATDLAVLAAPTAEDQVRAYTLGQDGSELLALGSAFDGGQPIRIASTQRRGVQIGNSQLKVAMVGDQGSAWRYADVLSWVRIAGDITLVAYPG